LGKDIETSVNTATITMKFDCIVHNVVRERDGNNDLTYRIILETTSESDANVTKIQIGRRN
jgi:hypothetical protein